MIISIPEFGVNPAEIPQVVSVTETSQQAAGEVTGEVMRLVNAVSDEMKRSEIQQRLGLKHEDYFREAYLLPALRAGVIEMTKPDSPRSPKQKYRLTEKGKKDRHESRIASQKQYKESE